MGFSAKLQKYCQIALVKLNSKHCCNRFLRNLVKVENKHSAITWMPSYVFKVTLGMFLMSREFCCNRIYKPGP